MLKELTTTVSPACAGMIPTASAFFSRSSREPRMRGDDPKLFVEQGKTYE